MKDTLWRKIFECCRICTLCAFFWTWCLTLDCWELDRTCLVTALCSEGPMFRRSYVQKVLCSEGPLFRRLYVQKILCSEGSMFRRFYIQKVLCSEIFVQKVLCSESTGDYFICQFQLGTQRFCDVWRWFNVAKTLYAQWVSELKWGLIKFDGLIKL